MPSLDDFLSRIQTDYAFYLQFRQNPGEALTDYDLSADERDALTGSGLELSARLGQTILSLTSTKNVVALGLAELELNVTTALARPQVQQVIDKIREADTPDGRLTAISTLMEHIG
jgi:hypothetical protein